MEGPNALGPSRGRIKASSNLNLAPHSNPGPSISRLRSSNHQVSSAEDPDASGDTFRANAFQSAEMGSPEIPASAGNDSGGRSELPERERGDEGSKK